MTAQETKVLQAGVKVFKVLAWISLAVQGVMGFVLIISGGEAVPIGGVDVPARIVGLLNVVAAVVYFFMFLLIGAVVRLLLEVHARGQ